MPAVMPTTLAMDITSAGPLLGKLVACEYDVGVGLAAGAGVGVSPA
jgi:hypothetical protein